MKEKNIVYLCGARDYHAMDWYFSAKEILKNRRLFVVTDLIAGEGFNKIISEEDEVHRLFILDKLLLNKQSKFGNIWRNLLKMLVLPIQVIKLRSFAKKHPNSIFHAHAMYYLFLAWAAKIEYVGTPQGSDILVRPYKSKLYRFFAIKALQFAKEVTVDSVSMRDKIKELSGVEAVIVQNGIDVKDILDQSKSDIKRARVLSIRGFTPLYRIDEILEARSEMENPIKIDFIYPFQDETYKEKYRTLLKKDDKDYGRVSREKMYDLLYSTKLVISIPKSDSSPRSVYEAIFCGCAVAVTENLYLDVLPICMRERIIVVDLDDEKWLNKALIQSEKITSIKYTPSTKAINMFDQKESFKMISELFY